MNKLLLATNNEKKRGEMSAILEELGFQCLTLKELGIEIDPEEWGITFEENAFIKANAAMKASNLPAIADDSGLCCDALGGAPGVHSARYCEGSDEDRLKYLLENMAHVEQDDRTAHFSSAICCVFPNGDVVTGYGECRGVIALKPTGEKGFGYDPIFYLPEHKGTFADIEPSVKNKISHRAAALGEFRKNMEDYLDGVYTR